MAKTKEEEVAFMRDPNEWPVWPVLPLKKRSGSYELGWLVETDEGVLPTVQIGNMYQGATAFQQYESFDALYDDGWRVD